MSRDHSLVNLYNHSSINHLFTRKSWHHGGSSRPCRHLFLAKNGNIQTNHGIDISLMKLCHQLGWCCNLLLWSNLFFHLQTTLSVSMISKLNDPQLSLLAGMSIFQLLVLSPPQIPLEAFKICLWDNIHWGVVF